MSEHQSEESKFDVKDDKTEHEYKFDVKMTCSGCSGAVSRALSKIEGITYDVNLQTQEVFVRGSADYQTVLDKIRKTGKEVRSGTVIV